jgi:hypothetical protein
MTHKKCFKCGEVRPIEQFHKHAMMKDGRLNKCAPCTVKDVTEWRLKNPDARKKEHARNRERKGFRTREVYYQEKAANKIGRKAVALKYTHKRNAQKLQHPVWNRELDDFVMEEAAILARLRAELFGGSWQIDHIVPLNHRQVCGLHNGFNLQVVPARWNQRKNNRHMGVWYPGAE